MGQDGARLRTRLTVMATQSCEESEHLKLQIGLYSDVKVHFDFVMHTLKSMSWASVFLS